MNPEIDPSTSIASPCMGVLVHSSPVVGSGSLGKERTQGPRIGKELLPLHQNGGTVVSEDRRGESVQSVYLGFGDEEDEALRTQSDAFTATGSTSITVFDGKHS